MNHIISARSDIAVSATVMAFLTLAPNIATLLTEQKVDLIVNLPRTQDKNEAGFKIRRLAIDHHIPLITNPQLAQIFLQCLAEVDPASLPVRSWGELSGC
jgi:hypothetical protein